MHLRAAEVDSEGSESGERRSVAMRSGLNRKERKYCYPLLAFCALSLLMASCSRQNSPARFRITMPKSLRSTAADGRMLLVISKDGSKEPRKQVSDNVLTTQQLFGTNVDGLQPDASVVVDASALGYPLNSLGDVPEGDYYVQAVLNMYETVHRADGKVLKLPMDHWEGQQWNIKPGNLYSTVRKIHVASGKTIDISLDKVIPELPYPKDTPYLKYVRIQSKLLTAFWGRPVELGVFVLLPPGWDTHPNAHYPLVITPAHFPTTLAGYRETPPTPDLKGVERAMAEFGYKFYQDWNSDKLPHMLIMTIQHATPYYDDSYGVNSPNNGPYGDAITQELIPEIEKRFRGIGQPWSRVLTGCSTGGWEALGMQVKYPDFYNGEWTGAPSPIDFRAWRLVNIYANKNAYYYNAPWAQVPIPAIGNREPATVAPADRMDDDRVATTMEQDDRIELVVGDHGRGAGLWDGMQAVFGPVGADGYPGMIWDKKTGEINPEVATYWRDHSDLDYIMRRDWSTLGPKLVGKIHLAVGTSDQFYLANAVRYTAAFLESTKDPYYDGTVEYGTRQIHCYWGGDPALPGTTLRGQVYQRQMPLMQQRMLKTAPPGADTRSWRY